MEKIKLLFIAKTNLNTDGRILNQIKLIRKAFGTRLLIDFILMPDKPISANVSDVDTFHVINTSFRGIRILQFVNVLQFSFKALVLLIKLRPDIIHTQDSAVSIPVLSYRVFFDRSVRVIYDDHEIPNENESFLKKMMNGIEARLIRKADWTISANSERMQYIKNKYHLPEAKLSYFLNLNYFPETNQNVPNTDRETLSRLDNEIAMGVKFILHQGPIYIERGRSLLADFSNRLPESVKILLIGGSRTDFDDFVKEYNLKSDRFYFVGSVNYALLNQYWRKADASIVLYLPRYRNNRFCAPNRFYLSMEYGLPVIVNGDNPVLVNYIKEFQCGFFIHDFSTDKDFRRLFSFKNDHILDIFDSLKQKEEASFIFSYEGVLERSTSKGLNQC